MSVRRKSNSTGGRKPKVGVNNMGDQNKSEVKELKKSHETTSTGNKNDFCDITHKNSSGATNWVKFAKILGENKISQSNNKPLNNKNQVQLESISKKSKQNVKSKFPYKNVQGTNVSANNTGSVISKPALTKHIAMDCEMVGVEIGVNKSMLARISLVNSHGDCIYDKYVKPTEPVLDYRTRVSGVRPRDLENATDFKIVQSEVADMLKGRILVGHALRNDLRVLYLSHPKHSIRDTSRFKKFREGKAPALRKLAKTYLGVTIQDGEHSSVQDALAAMQLYKMFKKEWETSIFSKKRQVKKPEKSELPQSTFNKSVQDT